MNFTLKQTTVRLAVFIALSMGVTFAYSQNAGCKVRDQDIAAIYKGGCKDGLAHGKGLAKGKDVFEGEFFEGDKLKGKYTWASGNVYEGEYKNDQKHGQGKSTWTNGNSYEGAWVNGKAQGPTEFDKKRVAEACSMDLGGYRLKVCGPDQTTNNFRCILEAQEKYAELRKSCSK